MKQLKYKIVFFISSLSVWTEHLLRAFWPLVFSVLFLCGLVLWGVAGFLPNLALQAILFFVLFLGVSYGSAHFIKPQRTDIEKRLVQVNEWPYDPFRALRDQPSHQFSARQTILWAEKETRSRKMIAGMRPVFPRIRIGKKDPLGVRYLALVVFIAGLLHNGVGSADLLASTMMPQRPAILKPATVDIWLTPPEYTKLQPYKIAIDDENPVSLPAGSRLNAFVSKGFLTPKLHTNVARQEFSAAPDGGYTIEYTLAPEDRRIKIKSGLASHKTLYVIQQPDIVPIISLVEGPDVTENNALKFRFVSRDDFGIAKVEFVMRPDPMVAHRLNNPSSFMQSYDIGGEQFTDQNRSLALSDHPWAGLPVEIELRATDTKGQTTTSGPVSFVLPEREFTHPLARRLAEIRKDLFWNADQDTMRIFAAQVFNLQSRVESYNGDLGIFMGLGAAGFRMLNMKQMTGQNMASLQQLLWDLALRVEGGSSRIAAENLQNTLAEVMQALQNPNLTEEEFAKLQQKLEQAIGEYTQSLMNELAAQMQQQGIESIPQDFENMVQQQINPGSMMQKLQDLLQNGSREDIANALQQMQDMIEQMKNRQFQPMTADMQKSLAEAAQLKDLIRRQEMLLDETRSISPDLQPRTSQNYAEELGHDNSIFNDPENIMPPMPSGELTPQDNPAGTPIEKVESEKQAETQARINNELSALQMNIESRTNKKADFMTRAGKAMDYARQSLDADRPDLSIPHQERALRELKNGLDQTMQQMAQSLGSIITLTLPRPGQGKRPVPGEQDPFGRQMAPNGDMTGTVNMQDEENRRRIQDIRDKILENADDIQDDPVSEDYFDRLLERF